MSRTDISRIAEKGRTERAELDTLLDATWLGHVALVREDGWPVVIPTAVVRDGDRLLLHGSTGSPWMRTVAGGAPVSVAVTAVDGVVVARSAFESSIHYRSAVLFGTCTRLEGADKERALDLLTDGLIPGRTGEVRPSTRRELAATMVLALPIAEWSLKVSDDFSEDPDSDVAGDAWAGVVPLAPQRHGAPLPHPDLRPGIEVPASVRALTGDAGRADGATSGA
ncbi:MAG: pyridoxamine 5'-phosphate oxidase family protein [Nocardioides sp.]|uniref:pyridoxamine 5'-phosphate oxidase family protein n=1 Tax=Nocardioides sp. TaxID=35761 RepID=UPI0039E3DDA1